MDPNPHAEHALPEEPFVTEPRIVITDPDATADESVFYSRDYESDRQLTDQATTPVILMVTVEGLGRVNDYSLRIEVPAFDDNVAAISRIVETVTHMVFELAWDLDRA